MLFHLVGAEQFRPQRRFVVGVRMRRVPAAQARRHKAQGVADTVTASLHFRFLVRREIATPSHSPW